MEARLPAMMHRECMCMPTTACKYVCMPTNACEYIRITHICKCIYNETCMPAVFVVRRLRLGERRELVALVALHDAVVVRHG